MKGLFVLSVRNLQGTGKIIRSTRRLHTPNNSFHMTQHLTCRHYGIYVATCCICKEQYLGQTKNRFSIR